MASPENQFILTSKPSQRLTTQEDIEPHTKPLILHSATLTSLTLSGNTLGPPAAQYLSTLLPSLQNLVSANLADIFTSRLLSEIPTALSALLEGLGACKRLERVDLSDNAFGLNTVEPLVLFLRRHNPLKHLILQNNGLGPAAGAMVADALTELAEKKAKAREKEEGNGVPELETLICGRNRLENGSMGAWARCFGAHRHVREVKMVQNGIRQEGIMLLFSEGLAQCEDLRVLDLQDNTFTITGAEALCSSLGKWKELKELGVGDCLLGARGGVKLGEELGKGENKGLEVIRAQYNEIDARGVKALFDAADALPKLKRVEINGNKFAEDDEGVEGLRTLLDDRKEKAGGEGEEGAWGLDELSDLEEESDEEDEEEAEEDEEEEKRERVLKEADQEEAENVAEKKDADVDALADELGGTHIKSP